MEALFWIGIAIGIPVALLNSLMYSPLSSKLEKRWQAQPLCRRRAVLILFTLVSWTGLFLLIHQPMCLYEPEVRPCIIKLGTAVEPSLKYLVEETGYYPDDMREFIKGVESQDLMVRGDFADYLICPYNKTREISFEYFSPKNLKPDLGKFIVLYEKPNNHFYNKKSGNYRSILFSDGSVTARPENEVYNLLMDQSKNKDAFSWEPSNFEGSRPCHAKGWWEVELAKKTRPKAIALSGAIILLWIILIFL